MLSGGLGPYHLYNTIPRGILDHELTPALVVRADIIFSSEPVRPAFRTDSSAYIGADFFDEIAALLSLSLGVRFRSGGITREWGIGDIDTMGTPVEYDHSPPYLSKGHRGLIIPSLDRTVNINEAIPLLGRFRATSPASAIAIMRACRLYQQAMWISDADPNQAWLQLVSAIEVAAQEWSGAKVCPLDRLREAWPDLAAAVEAAGPDHARTIAGKLAPLVKSQRKFLGFMDNFLPEPPPERPEEWARIDWHQMSDYLRTIYTYRSDSLHAGTPFPWPMCQIPRKFERGIPIERPLGISAGIPGASWLAKDVPMLLSTFEYIARSALQQWWHELAPA